MGFVLKRIAQMVAVIIAATICAMRFKTKPISPPVIRDT
jgi:hypothetical protein